MNVPKHIQDRISKDVEKYVAIAASHFGKDYRIPAIHYDVRGRVAGYAEGVNTVRFNPILLMENLETFIARTVPHEVAHCIDSANGDNARPVGLYLMRNGRRPKRSVHGPSWERIMRLFGVKDIGRCHDYDVKNAQVRVKAKFEYKCSGCQKSFFVSSVLHNKMRMGQERWGRCCGRARGRLVYAANLGQKTYQELAAHTQQLQKKEPLDEAIKHIKEIPIIEFRMPTLDLNGNISERARKIYKMYGHLGRQVAIRKMMEIGVKETTASTYFQNFRSGK